MLMTHLTAVEITARLLSLKLARITKEW